MNIKFKKGDKVVGYGYQTGREYIGVFLGLSRDVRDGVTIATKDYRGREFVKISYLKDVKFLNKWQEISI